MKNKLSETEKQKIVKKIVGRTLDAFCTSLNKELQNLDLSFIEASKIFRNSFANIICNLFSVYYDILKKNEDEFINFPNKTKDDLIFETLYKLGEDLNTEDLLKQVIDTIKKDKHLH